MPLGPHLEFQGPPRPPFPPLSPGFYRCSETTGGGSQTRAGVAPPDGVRPQAYPYREGWTKYRYLLPHCSTVLTKSTRTVYATSSMPKTAPVGTQLLVLSKMLTAIYSIWVLSTLAFL
ncbi:hypothetical protein L916_21487 [Phytophthora nicotianae]|uniref:Uncharacterized protein n=1 Tax=Phytophthora nicotianae TaxID=4792 RepID=W2HRF7_PHYNI|nr:hypothetical protein L916_21487 [Phytophthora nicotianae]